MTTEWLGTTFDGHEARVDPDAAVAFALATNDPNHACLDGSAVPPLYTGAMIRLASVLGGQRLIESGAITGARHAVHGEQDVYFLKAIEPGATLRWNTTTYSVRQTRPGVVVTQKAVVTDANGVPVVEHFWSNVHLGGTVNAESGPDLAGHAFPSEARANLIGSHEFELSADQVYRYAGVSGDHVAHAVDGEAARAEGFPGRILQGLCTMAMCSGAVVKLAADGDPDRLRRLACRMSAPVLANANLTVEVYDAGRADDGGRVIAFEATSGGVAVIKHGRADLRPS
ncbi:MaoC/PaaZ C-terminal domain-containing protein [Jatrophihabitans sp. DSM 45814]